MSFFEGDEAFAIVKVPDDFLKAIESASASDYIGSVVVKNNKKIEVKLRTNQLVKNFNLEVKPKKDLTFILDEKKDELKISKVAKFDGNIYPIFNEDLVNEIAQQTYKSEKDKVETQIDKDLWGIDDLQKVESARGKERESQYYSDSDLINKLFGMFQKKPYIHIDEILNDTRAAKSALDRTLKQIAEIHEPKVYKLKDQYLREANTTPYEAPPSKKIKY